MKLSVIIPTYNGEALLRQYLPDNLEILENDCGSNFEVILADDNSSDSSRDYIATLNKPYLNWLTNPGRRGFGSNCNNAVSKAKGEFIFFLNNDVALSTGTLSTLIKKLSLEPSFFGVVPPIFRPSENNRDEAPTAAKLSFWHIDFYHPEPPLLPTPVLWGCGAAFVCRRSVFEELKGFFAGYEPYYTEDADLGMKAWRRGYQILYIPCAGVKHFHSSTIPKLEKQKALDQIRSRNRYLFLL